jgi:hypothetical protein
VYLVMAFEALDKHLTNPGDSLINNRDLLELTRDRLSCIRSLMRGTDVIEYRNTMDDPPAPPYPPIPEL